MWIGMTRDKILHYASSRHGMSEPLEGPTLRLVNRMISEGLLVRQEKTAHLPALTGIEAEHSKHFGWPTEARQITYVTLHLTDAGRAAWLRGSL